MATSTNVRVGAALRKAALTYPEAYEEYPWDGYALKVRKKVFLFMHYDAKVLSLSLKLPDSNGAALMFPFAKPTGYGLGKSGWVTAKFNKGPKPPLPLLKAWLDESYRAVAPAKLAALVPAEDGSRSPTRRKAQR